MKQLKTPERNFKMVHHQREYSDDSFGFVEGEESVLQFKAINANSKSSHRIVKRSEVFKEKIENLTRNISQ